MVKKMSFDAKHMELAAMAKALSHPARVYILKVLANQPCCYSGDMAEELPIARSTLSQHLKELKMAGLIRGEIEPPMIKYCINPEKWNLAKDLFLSFFNENNSPQHSTKQKGNEMYEKC